MQHCCEIDKSVMGMICNRFNTTTVIILPNELISMRTTKIKFNQVKYRKFITINYYDLIFILPFKNAMEAFKCDFLADPGIIRPEFANSFLSRALPMSLFQTLVALNTNFCLLNSPMTKLQGSWESHTTTV